MVKSRTRHLRPRAQRVSEYGMSVAGITEGLAECPAVASA